MNLQPKQKLTVFSISSSMAHTTKQEIEVMTVLETPEERLRYVRGPLDGHRLGMMKPRGKRKEFHLDIKLGDLVFEGWDLPVVPDSEIVHPSGCSRFSGNACFNLGVVYTQIPGVLRHEGSAESEADLLRAFIMDKNLNLPLLDSTKGACVLVCAGDGYDDGELLWPEIDIAHAVVNRMKEKATLALR